MHAGHPPFKGASEVLLFEAICRKKPTMRVHFPLELKAILLGLLAKDPFHRLGSSLRGSMDIKERESMRLRSTSRSFSVSTLDAWFRQTDFHAIFAQQLPSPFYKHVMTKSVSEHRQESLTRSEKPLLIADEDDYHDDFKDF